MRELQVESGPFKAVFVKFIGPTNRRGARLKAYDCDGNSVTLSYDHGATQEERYTEAAKALCVKMGWTGRLVGGGTDEGQVFVFVEQQKQPRSVVVQFANAEDTETAGKVLKRQQTAGKEQQTLSGLDCGLLRAAVQRALNVEVAL